MSLRDAVDWTSTALNDPVGQLSRWQRSVRTAVRIGRYSLRHLAADRAPQMAAALAFRMLFGLLPVLVVATVVAKSVLGPELPSLVDRAVKSLGMTGVQLTIPATNGEPPRAVDLGTWAAELVGFAASINLATLGWIGFAVVAFSAVWVLVTIEGCFNDICRAPASRRWWARIPVYWFALTFGPLALAVLPIANHWLMILLRDTLGIGGLANLATGLLDFALMWAFWCGAYLWVPNTRLDLKPVLIGSLVTTVLLTLGRSFLGLYLRNAFGLSGLYGSLGLIPLFMFWTYLMWLFVLLGLQIASLLQTLRQRSLDDLEQESGRTEFVDPAEVVALMELASERFGSGGTVDSTSASAALAIPEVATARMLEELARRGFLHRLERGGFALASPPSQIDAASVMEVGFALADRGGHSRGEWIARLRAAQRSIAAGMPLATAAAPARS